MRVKNRKNGHVGKKQTVLEKQKDRNSKKQNVLEKQKDKKKYE
ncbi:MAG: hypothetical protein AB2784_12065 [Candidatus Thiodiazotropha endolucinida]